MRAGRKNAKRLKRLRQLGVPISGDYRLSAPFHQFPEGAYLSRARQKALLQQLGVSA